ncbi:MAG: O-antigen ligase family protein [Campylobacteraceae bacterium]
MKNNTSFSQYMTIKKILIYDYFIRFLVMIWIVSIPFKDSMYQISTILIIIFLLFDIAINKHFLKFRETIYSCKNIILVFGLIFFCMFLSNIINHGSETSLWRTLLLNFYRYFLIFLALLYFYNRDFFSKKLILYFIFLSLGIQAFDGVYQSFYGYDIFKNIEGNLKIGLTGSTFNRNIFGMLTGFGVLVSFLSLKKYNAFYSNIFIIIFLFLFMFSVLFSYSRAVWVSLFVSLVVYFCFNYKNIKKIHFLYIFIVTSVLFFMFLGIDSLEKRFVDLISIDSSNRDIIWMNSINFFTQKPLFGWGLGAYKLSVAQNGYSFHNSTLEVLVSMGILGFLAYLSLILVILKEVIKNKQIPLLCLFVYILIDCQFDQSILHGKVFLSSIVVLLFFIFSERIDRYKYKDLQQ